MRKLGADRHAFVPAPHVLAPLRAARGAIIANVGARRCVLFVQFDEKDIALGAAADGLIPQGLTGKTVLQLEAQSADAYGMFDFSVRSNGWSLVLLGVLLASFDRPTGSH